MAVAVTELLYDLIYYAVARLLPRAGMRSLLGVCEELFRALPQFVRCHLLDPLGEPPAVAGGIFEASGTIAPELILQRHDGLAAGIDRSLPRRVHIFRVYEEANRCTDIRF